MALLAAVAGRTLRLRALAHHEATETYESVYYLPEKEWLPSFSVGYDEAVADGLWMRALIYYGDELSHQASVDHVFHYADAILTLDSHFRRVYRWAGMAGMYHGDSTMDDVRESIGFLERGVRQFPDDPEMAWDLGASLKFELAPHLEAGEEKEQASLRGLEFMQSAARMGYGPSWMVLANANQLRDLGQTEQAIRHLEEMYDLVDDADVRANIEEQITQLRTEADARALQATFEELEAGRQRDFPYVDAGLYLLLVEPASLEDLDR
ncbi:MAG: hypothetical protein AAGF12_12340 [Myxococcota bacterium]